MLQFNLEAEPVKSAHCVVGQVVSPRDCKSSASAVGVRFPPTQQGLTMKQPLRNECCYQQRKSSWGINSAVECFFCKEKAIGSNPISSTTTDERSGDRVNTASARHHSLIKGAWDRSSNGNTTALHAVISGSNPGGSTTYQFHLLCLEEIVIDMELFWNQ